MTEAQDKARLPLEALAKEWLENELLRPGGRLYSLTALLKTVAGSGAQAMEFRPHPFEPSVTHPIIPPASAHKAEEPAPTDPWFARPCIGPPGHRELGHEAEDGRCKWCGLPESTAPPYCHCRLSGVRHIHDEEHGIIAAPEPADKAGASTEQDILERIDEAIRRITQGFAPMRIPANPCDPDLVLGACRREIVRLRAAEAAARAEEREECAKVLDAEVKQHREEQDPEAYPCGPPRNNFCENYGCYSLEAFAKAIRARGASHE